jgi:lipopolysaccharide export system ATP-binding protein
MPISEIEQALAHFKNGDPAKAIPILEELVRMVPTYVMAHVLLAQAYEAIQREDKAMAAWNRAHSVIPGSPVRSAPGFDGADLPEGDSGPVAADREAEAERGDGLPEHLPSGVLMLRAESLIKRYKKRTVVKAVSLNVRQGEIVGLLGPNGAGKTTTFHMIVGLERPDKGKVFIGEDDITTLPMYARARRGIGYLAQEASIFSHLTVEDNLHAVLEYQPMSREERRVRVEELIAEFGLETVRRSRGYMLSGGERRRTEIARALATRPAFFLLDEPFAGVDPIAVEDIQSIVAGLKARGIGVLITDHNVHETLAITDRAYLLFEGKILKQGTAEALASDPEVRKRYLGEKFTLERYQ